MHDTTACPMCRGRGPDGSMSDAEFNAFVGACQQELEQKQIAFQARISGAGRWAYEMADGTLTIGDTFYPMVPIGTFSRTYQSWLWAWANEDFPARTRETSCQLQALHQITGFRIFLKLGFPAAANDVNEFLALAVHQLGGIGFFRCESDGPTLYLAVQEPGIAEPGDVRERR
jgi:hypothetical protein